MTKMSVETRRSIACNPAPTRHPILRRDRGGATQNVAGPDAATSALRANCRHRSHRLAPTFRMRYGDSMPRRHVNSGTVADRSTSWAERRRKPAARQRAL